MEALALDPGTAARQARFAALKARSFELLQVGPTRGQLSPVQRFDPNEPRDEHGQWTDGGGSDGGGGTDVTDAPTAFVSPNVGHLTFQQAKISLNGARQKMLAEASKDIDAKLGKQPVEAHNVIGAWSDGAENSLLLRMPGWTPAEARVALAMKGYIGDQKSALLFNPDPSGAAFVASFPVKGELDSIHNDLLKDGLAFHTLEPISGGALVHVYGDDQATVDAINKVTEANGTKGQIIAGHGEFIGTAKSDGTDREQRDDARKQYAAIISEAATGSEFAGRDLAKTWDDLRDHWDRKLSELEKSLAPLSVDRDWARIRAAALAHLGPTRGHLARAFDPNEPRDESGKWTDGGGSDGGGSTGGGSADKPRAEAKPASQWHQQTHNLGKALHDQIRTTLPAGATEGATITHDQTSVAFDNMPITHAQGRAVMEELGFVRTTRQREGEYVTTNFVHPRAERAGVVTGGNPALTSIYVGGLKPCHTGPCLA